MLRAAGERTEFNIIMRTKVGLEKTKQGGYAFLFLVYGVQIVNEFM